MTPNQSRLLYHKKLQHSFETKKCGFLTGLPAQNTCMQNLCIYTRCNQIKWM